MQNQLPLRDIHLPDTLPWWPPAPGWWLLLLATMMLLGLAYLLVRKLRQPLVNKTARAELEVITRRYQRDADKQRLLQDLSSLLRRVGISYLGRQKHAGLTGERWYQQLNQLVAEPGFSAQQIALLSQAPYQPSAGVSDEIIDLLIRQTRQWLAGLPRQRRLADV